MLYGRFFFVYGFFVCEKILAVEKQLEQRDLEMGDMMHAYSLTTEEIAAVKKHAQLLNVKTNAADSQLQYRGLFVCFSQHETKSWRDTVSETRKYLLLSTSWAFEHK
jgi:hypothetical protein